MSTSNLFDFDFEPAPKTVLVLTNPTKTRSDFDKRQPDAIKAPAAPQRDRNFSDNHALAFRAVARHYGHADPALAGDCPKELARFANELLRGIRSDKPTMTPERWGEARAKVLGLAGVKTASQKTPQDWARERAAFTALTCHCGSPLALVGARWGCLNNCGKVPA